MAQSGEGIQAPEGGEGRLPDAVFLRRARGCDTDTDGEHASGRG